MVESERNEIKNSNLTSVRSSQKESVIDTNLDDVVVKDNNTPKDSIVINNLNIETNTIEYRKEKKSIRFKTAVLGQSLPGLNLRGNATAVHLLTYEGNDGVKINLFLGVQKRGIGYIVNGQLGLTEEVTHFFEEAKAEIWQNSSLVATTSIDSVGAFMCPLEKNRPFTVQIRTQNNLLMTGDVIF